jgi:hypothetical protein
LEQLHGKQRLRQLDELNPEAMQQLLGVKHLRELISTDLVWRERLRDARVVAGIPPTTLLSLYLGVVFLHDVCCPCDFAVFSY